MTRRLPKFERLERRLVDAAETTINLVLGGASRPVLLLHGYPPMHVMWRRTEPLPAERHTVVASDLRGYGNDGKPPSAADRALFAKRTMAEDQRRVMEALGFDRFRLVGHDRSAGVGYRLVAGEGGARAALRAPALDRGARLGGGFGVL